MLREYDKLYDYPDPGSGKCFYCGDKSTSVDHIPALDLVDKYGPWSFHEDVFLKVQACHQCNSLLGNLDKSLHDRYEFLYLKISKIYQHLGIPKTEPERDKKEKVLRRLNNIHSKLISG